MQPILILLLACFFFGTIGIILGYVFGAFNSPMVKKYGTEYYCGKFEKGTFSDKEIYCYGEKNNELYLIGTNKKKESIYVFPFKKIAKFELININSYNSVAGAIAGNFVGGGIGAVFGASGDDKIYIKIVWTDETTSLIVLNKIGYDRFIKNTYNY